MYKEDIRKLLNESNPEIALRNFALKLYSKKLSKKEIYYIFYEYYDSIIDDDNEQSNIDILGDVMDMIWGGYSGKNIDFEKEIYNND